MNFSHQKIREVFVTRVWMLLVELLNQILSNLFNSKEKGIWTFISWIWVMKDSALEVFGDA